MMDNCWKKNDFYFRKKVNIDINIEKKIIKFGVVECSDCLSN